MGIYEDELASLRKRTADEEERRRARNTFASEKLAALHAKAEEQRSAKRKEYEEMTRQRYVLKEHTNWKDCDTEYRWEKKKGCFVATAVYGDIDAPQVQALRDFRDHVLVQSRIGRLAVKFYYGGAGESAAGFLESGVPKAIPLIRKGLDYIVEKYRKGQA